ncbi:MAG: hypothetical protein ACO2Z9_08330 [Crocinitomicaceae bacterium]
MKYILAVIILISTTVFAQDSTLAEYEQALSVTLKKLRMAESNVEKEKLNSDFKTTLEKALAKEEALSYPFSQLSSVGIIDSPDKKMRIINWNVEQEDFSHKYYCFVIWKGEKGKEHHYQELMDISFGMAMQPTETISADQWYGALYYKIIPVTRRNKTLYTVLGWDHFTEMSSAKLIDVIYFVGNDVKLGMPIFKAGSDIKRRMFFEHSEKTSMYLNYEADRERIMMDHLSPESPSMANFREFYVPDLSYDAMEFDGKRWNLIEDVIGVNPGNGKEKQVVYTKNEDGKIEAKEIKSDWQDPSNPDAPAGGNIHVAVPPD